MKKTLLLQATALSTMLFAGAAYAQETQTTQDPPETLQSEQEAEAGQDAESNAQPADSSATQGDAIVVTGSRIRRPNLDSPLPVTSVGGQEFFETGQTSPLEWSWVSPSPVYRSLWVISENTKDST